MADLGGADLQHAIPGNDGDEAAFAGRCLQTSLQTSLRGRLQTRAQRRVPPDFGRAGPAAEHEVGGAYGAGERSGRGEGR